MATRDPGEIAADALNDFFGQLFSWVETAFTRFFSNLYSSFADVSVNRWTKVICSVIGYILVRPYIEKFFKKMQDREIRKEREKKEKAEAERAAGGGKKKKAKVSANALRGGAGAGKVLGEVENTDDEIEGEEGADGAAEEEEEVDFATASGVPEWGKNARKRQKKYWKSLEKEAESRTQQLSEEQIKELLDWSESEDEKKK
ncbi:hypothetical protein BO70DRAFT_349850 [Aspergillus heteromorphus CBS 117.55]|uniref:DUF1531-domain-containing protein n=1 Tax=Aspergillus heteromorphus CBS 117.55 TaxID=1448321 RepID=A0A317WU30_9EURO|nr:uncharacterized protein BO70DRAFT_349850 [Aspergillus heteromorphus CBS 117.55]PWY89839.1 hypothetical protein BO70DRAFT_349850 [Aspergillus heteromorphus CBS 117.55]